MKLLFLFFILFFLTVPGRAADLTCPPSPVTSKNQTGHFPSDGITLFPANYGCALEFEIPDGQVIKFIVQTNAIHGYGDKIVIRDSISTLYEMDVGESLFYAPANNSKLWISTKTNTSSFYFSWEYIDVTIFKRIQSPTGSITALNFTENHFYQFNSSKSRVAFHTGSIDRSYDLSLTRIYVYDGVDLNSNYLGNLLQFTGTKNMSASTGKSLTLVNFYGTPTKSFGIANDYSAVFGYSAYTFFILSSDIVYSGHGLTPTGMESAVTFFCLDSMETYITNLSMDDQKVGAQAVRFKPLTPSHVYSNLLVYNVGEPIAQSLPQQIFTNLFTMVMYQSDVQLSLSSGPLYIWSLAVPGRKGLMISPSIWNPTKTTTSTYLTNFTSSETLKFKFNLQSIIIGKEGEKIRIEIGAPNKKPVGVEFNETSTDTGLKAAYGTYMSTVFTGTTLTSSFFLTFSFEGNATTTTVFPETTTKSSNTPYSIFIFILVFAKV